MSVSNGKLSLSSHKPTNTLNVFTSLLRSRFSTSITICVVFFLASFIAIFIAFQSWYIVVNTKTIAGDNLRPTPWHMFHLPLMNKWDPTARFLPIAKCGYLSCSMQNLLPIQQHSFQTNTSGSCPEYFQWIYEDLAPWRRSKITKKNLKAAQSHAAFRVIIVDGRLYIDFYYACVLPRVMFTLWGLLQLLERYPGRVPDVDLMFDCMDRPTISKHNYRHDGPSPPPLFRYCSDASSFDIPFPDWSFWGWPQIDIPPWTEEAKNIYIGSKDMQWQDRRPTAYWKGNPDVGSDVRVELLKCNVSDQHNWGAEIFRQNWWAEGIAGFKDSKVSQQCKNRFKIYTEGHAWSVSFKYIFSCDSPVLLAIPTYYEFFTRGLLPMVHYWPVRKNHLCPSIKFAVDWGNNHTDKAKQIGKAGQEFMWRNLTMDYVYDYMFHLLSEYSKLQDFKPVVPSSAQLLCEKSVFCFADDPKTKDFLRRSKSTVSNMPPCIFSHYDHQYIQSTEQQREQNTEKIWGWEKKASVHLNAH